jgi:hypothetical protein
MNVTMYALDVNPALTCVHDPYAFAVELDAIAVPVRTELFVSDLAIVWRVT